jgi:hypothetical protein
MMMGHRNGQRLYKSVGRPLARQAYNGGAVWRGPGERRDLSEEITHRLYYTASLALSVP